QAAVSRSYTGALLQKFFGSAVVEVSGDTTKTLDAVSKTYLFNGSGDATWTLPTVSGNTQLIIRIKNKTAHTITVQRAGSDNIFTFTTTTSITVGQGESVTLVNDGTHWTTIRASESSGIRSGDASEGEEGVYTLTLDPAITEYTDGAAFLIRFDISSINGVGEDTTLNINSLGAKSIRRYPGVRLIPGDIHNVQHYFVTYNESADHFQVHHLPFLPNSVTNKASYVDILGRFRIAQGSTYDASSQAWTHTSATNDGSEVARWNNSDSELLFRLLSDFVAEFGHDGTHVIEVSDGITNGNAFLRVPVNQAQAYQAQDKNSNKIYTLKTTTGDIALILHGFEKDLTGAFKIVVKQAFTSVPTTAGAQNAIASISALVGLPIKVKVNFAFAAIGAGRLISIDSLEAIALNSSGTTAGTVKAGDPVYSGGPTTGGFNMNINDTTDEIEIRFENESGTGYAYTVWVEYEYI